MATEYEERIVFFDSDNPDIKIKAIVNGPLGRPTLIMMHGVPADPYGSSFAQVTRDAYSAGFTVVRLFMYANDTNTRDLLDCTLATHVTDFESVVAQLKPQAPKLFAIGHSYGGITILMSDTQLDGAVLWDPSHGSFWQSKPLIAEYQTAANDARGHEFAVSLGGKMSVVPLALYQYQATIGDTSALARKPYPLKIISAGQGPLAQYGEQYYQMANQPKERVVIQDATHALNNTLAVLDELSNETCTWLTKLSVAPQG